MKNLTLVLMLLLVAVFVCTYVDAQAQDDVHYDDEDGHREPWEEWRSTVCRSEPKILMDCDTCNSNTNLGVTVWICNDGSGDIRPWSYYTAHWFCGVFGPAIKLVSYYFPLIWR